MKFKEILQMPQPERDRKMKELELELIKLNTQVATGTPPKNSGSLRRIKKDIARLLLIKSQAAKKQLKNKTKNKTKTQ